MNLTDSLFYSRPNEIFVENFYDSDDYALEKKGYRLLRRSYFSGDSELLLFSGKEIVKGDKVRDLIGDEPYRNLYTSFLTKRFRIQDEVVDVFRGWSSDGIKFDMVRSTSDPTLEKLETLKLRPSTNVGEFCELLLSDLMV